MIAITDEKKRRWLIYAAALIIVLLIGYLAWPHPAPPEPVTPMSQQQAETPVGVGLAAKQAHIEMLQQQLDDAARKIAELKNREPETVIKTVPVEVEKVVVKEVEKRGADFAIVTDPANPDKPVDLNKVSKLPEGTTVNLNQYNVYAYRKVIRGVNVYPDWSEAARGKFKIDEVTADISRKVTNDGKYIGVVVGYDFKHDHAKAGIRYSF